MANRKRKSASSSEMESLHKFLAVYLTHEIKGSLPPELGGYEEELEDELDEDGEPTGNQVKAFRMPMSDSKLGVIAKFLKDNDVTCEPDDPTLKGLKDEFEDDFKARRDAHADKIAKQTLEQAEKASWVS